MTEIPEHLLKRSKQAKAKATGDPVDEGADSESSDSGAGAPAATTPATTEAPAAPALAARSPESTTDAPAVPDPPYVVAAKTRKKAPIWVVPVLAFLPLWAILYAGVLEVREAEGGGFEALGAELFTGNCAACHGPSGGGGVGPQLSGGEVLLTFPSIDDQMAFVTDGSVAGAPYGDPGRDGGQRVASGGMPSFASFTEDELLAVICHERQTLSGGEEEACSADGAGAGGESHG
ncbi:MAG TPA: cytochrome c [Acidimicrobiales bacterium]